MPNDDVDLHSFIAEFDHHDARFAQDPWKILSIMRDECPVLFSEAHGGMWVMTRYEDIVRVARDPETFCSGQGVVIGKPPTEMPEEVDPPEFFDYRRLLNPMFSQAAARRWESETLRSASLLVDSFIEAGECDLRVQFAEPFPRSITYQVLGIDPYVAERQRQAMLNRPAPHDGEVAAQFRALIDEMLQDAIDRNRKESTDSVIGRLCSAKIGDRSLTDEEIRNLARNVHNGGTITTTDAICNAVSHLDERSIGSRASLLREPGQLAVALEEFLRFEAPVMSLARTATKDVEIKGSKISAGDKVVLFWGSANRDESQFPDAAELVLDRNPNRHAAFGMGIHRCLGSHFARQQLRIALEEILRRLPDYEVDRTGVVITDDAGLNYNILKLPLRFSPGKREAVA